MTEARILVVTSGKGGVGKTTSSANLGMSIARLGYKVRCFEYLPKPRHRSPERGEAVHGPCGCMHGVAAWAADLGVQPVRARCHAHRACL